MLRAKSTRQNKRSSTSLGRAKLTNYAIYKLNSIIRSKIETDKSINA